MHDRINILFLKRPAIHRISPPVRTSRTAPAASAGERLFRQILSTDKQTAGRACAVNSAAQSP